MEGEDVLLCKGSVMRTRRQSVFAVHSLHAVLPWSLNMACNKIRWCSVKWGLLDSLPVINIAFHLSEILFFWSLQKWYFYNVFFRYRRVPTTRYLPMPWNLHQFARDLPMFVKEKYQQPSRYKIRLALEVFFHCHEDNLSCTFFLGSKWHLYFVQNNFFLKLFQTMSI